MRLALTPGWRMVDLPDGVMLPSSFSATIEHDDPHVEVELLIELDALGRPTCRRSQVTALGDDAITGETYRSLRLETDFIREAVGHAATWFRRSAQEGGFPTFVLPSAEERAQAYASVHRAPAARGTSATRSDLEEVAAIYCQVQRSGGQPRKAVEDRLGVSRATAARRIAAARRHGLL